MHQTLALVKTAKTEVSAAIYKKLGDVIDEEDMEAV